MGDSLQALWTEVHGETPEIVTYGDSQAAISIVRNPDGPWRTRHLRLRANVLRERAQQGRWKIFHMAGTQLIADYLTKSITVRASWDRFRAFTNLLKVENQGWLLKMGRVRRLRRNPWCGRRSLLRVWLGARL